MDEETEREEGMVNKWVAGHTSSLLRIEHC